MVRADTSPAKARIQSVTESVPGIVHVGLRQHHHGDGARGGT